MTLLPYYKVCGKKCSSVKIITLGICYSIPTYIIFAVWGSKVTNGPIGPICGEPLASLEDYQALWSFKVLAVTTKLAVLMFTILAGFCACFCAIWLVVMCYAVLTG